MFHFKKKETFHPFIDFFFKIKFAKYSFLFQTPRWLVDIGGTANEITGVLMILYIYIHASRPYDQKHMAGCMRSVTQKPNA